MTATARRFTKFVKRATSLASAGVLAFSTAFYPIAAATLALGTATTAAHAESGVANNYIRITAENAHKPKLIRLGIDKSIVVDLPAVANDVLVANPEVADAVMRTNRRIYLFGKQLGQTNIFIFDGAGKQIAAMEILIERDISGLEDSLARLIPNSNIKVEMINGSVVLTGTVATPSDASQAVNLAAVFLNTVGAVSFFQTVSEGEIVNLIKIEGEDQVQLRVTVAEISRAVVKQLGITTTAINPGTDGFGFTAFGQGNRSMSAAVGSGITGSITQGANVLQSQLSAMESAGVVRTLAEPNLTAVSGEAATFEVGGTQYFPSNIVTDDDGSRITYTEKPYGIKLDFTPVVLTEGRISLRLSTEVEEPTPLGAAQTGPVGGYAATRRRSATTTIELPSGGSMAIAGLVQDDIRQAISGMPGLSKVPILGSLFRSREFIRNESELVIIVTPYLVRPTARKNLVQPDENFQPASDAAGMFMGRVNRVYGTKEGDIPKGRYTGSIGFILK